MRTVPADPKPVVDATRSLRIRLQPADAVGAKRSSPRHCVIAQAVRRRRGVVDVRIGARTARVEHGDRIVRYLISANEQALIEGFDHGRDPFVEGYTITLLAPPSGRRLGDRRGEVHGTNKRSGRFDGVVRRAAHRHIDVDAEGEN